MVKTLMMCTLSHWKTTGITTWLTWSKIKAMKEYVWGENEPNCSFVSSFSYTYDVAGRQATKTDSFGTTNTNYTHDAAGRITRVEMPYCT
jgi:YD repeat-containing protein